jgi:hypothetical protein
MDAEWALQPLVDRPPDGNPHFDKPPAAVSSPAVVIQEHR